MTGRREPVTGFWEVGGIGAVSPERGGGTVLSRRSGLILSLYFIGTAFAVMNLTKRYML
jgi:hypothetical protein